VRVVNTTVLVVELVVCQWTQVVERVAHRCLQTATTTVSCGRRVMSLRQCVVVVGSASALVGRQARCSRELSSSASAACWSGEEAPQCDVTGRSVNGAARSRDVATQTRSAHQLGVAQRHDDDYDDDVDHGQLTDTVPCCHETGCRLA